MRYMPRSGKPHIAVRTYDFVMKKGFTDTDRTALAKEAKKKIQNGSDHEAAINLILDLGALTVKEIAYLLKKIGKRVQTFEQPGDCTYKWKNILSSNGKMAVTLHKGWRKTTSESDMTTETKSLSASIDGSVTFTKKGVPIEIGASS